MDHSSFSRFAAHKSGQFALVTAALTVPIVGAIGIALDYSRMSAARSELQQAADSAVLAAVSKAGETYKNGGTFNQLWTKGEAKKEANEWFKVNKQTNADYQVTKAKIDIDRQGVDITATIDVAASVKMTFMGVLGVSEQAVQVHSIAASSIAPYIDVHVLADNSPSMALGATPSDIAKLKSITGCAFACHDLSGHEDSYSVAVANKITLRIDATREALTSMVDTMKKVEEQYNQFRLAAYHFGDKIELQELTSFVGQTTDLVKAKTDSKSLKLMTVPYGNYNKNMSTDFKKQIDQISLKIGKAGKGLTSADRKQLLMLITDGVNTTYRPLKCPGTQTPWGQCQTPIDPTWCSALKARGVQIAVLNTTYYPVGDGWYNDWIKPFQSQIATKLSECASPGLFAEVEPHQGIEEAMQHLFFKTYPQPRLTN